MVNCYDLTCPEFMGKPLSKQFVTVFMKKKERIQNAKTRIWNSCLILNSCSV